MKINFYLKNPTDLKNQNKDALLFLFVSLYGDRLKKSIKFSLPVEKWDTQKQQVRKSHPRSAEINAYLNHIVSKIEDIYFENIRKEGFSFEHFKLLIEASLFPNKEKEEEKSKELVMGVFEEYLEVRKLEVSKATVKRTKVLYNHLKNYEEKYAKSLNFDDLTIVFFEKFRAYLLKDVKLTNNTLARYIKTVKTFLTWCIKRGYTDNDAYKEFKLKSEKTEVIYLTRDEFLAISRLDLSEEITLEKARDVFCFGCLTGQRYSDIAGLKRSDIKGNVWFLHVKKTRDIIKVPLTQPALDILDKYQHLNKPLPILTNQRTNLYLKEVAKLAGIDDEISYVRHRGSERIEIQDKKYNFVSTHTARRTFVTLSMEAGMTNPEIMAITGHKELKTLQKYSGSNYNSIKTKMDTIWDTNNSSK